MAHDITIIVNTKKVIEHKERVTFEDIVKIAFPTPPPGTIVYTVVYRNADEKKPDGSLSAGQSVKIKDGTVFNVTATDKS